VHQVVHIDGVTFFVLDVFFLGAAVLVDGFSDAVSFGLVALFFCSNIFIRASGLGCMVLKQQL
jgi:hypothetical protein